MIKTLNNPLLKENLKATTPSRDLSRSDLLKLAKELSESIKGGYTISRNKMDEFIKSTSSYRSYIIYTNSLNKLQICGVKTGDNKHNIVLARG